MGKTRLIATQTTPEAVFSMVYRFIFGRRHFGVQLDSYDTEKSKRDALAYFFLGAFFLQ